MAIVAESALILHRRTGSAGSGSSSRLPISTSTATLYKDQWITLLAMTDEIRAFLTEHDAELKTKSGA